VYFHSQTFLHVFLPFVLLAYYLVPAARTTLRNAGLFTASLFFYAWGERDYVLVLLGSLVVNYGYARAIEMSHRRKLWLVCAVLANLALLGWLKYAGFLATAIGVRPPRTHLPIGVSFFTFQAISYVVDVYRRDVPAERSFLRFGLYVFLFPHLIAGPIVRYADLAASLATRDHSVAQFADGVRRFTTGLAKKMLLADTLAVVADQVFRVPTHELAPSAAWIGMVCYSLQIYFDFSGYSDMAIGLGKMFGFEFAENFRHPYAAASVTDFWRRWHISLSSWFRDYVYIPLGGSRGGSVATYRNLLIVFVLCGLWHGANWTFVVWGLWHGLFLIAERLLPIARMPSILCRAVTLLAVLLGWVFFRAQSLEQAGGIFAALFGFTDGTYIAADVLTNAAMLALAVGVPCCLPLGSWLQRRWNAGPLGVVLMAGLLVLAAAAIAGNTYSAFIYFRF
jgi:alginate O-acetyltransferase complex protein AlgI